MCTNGLDFRGFLELARCGESAVAARWLGAQGPTGSLWNLLREEERQVSWAATVMAATAPKAGGSAPEAAASAEAPLQYSLLLQYLVGDKRQPRLLEPGSLGGIPSPAKSEEQKMIERAMESCAFKAALACVGGEAGPRAPWVAEGLGCSGVHCSEDHAPRRRGGPGPRP